MESANPMMATESPRQFTEASEQLARIVERFRQDTLPLEEALALYEQGVAHIRTCQTILTQCQGTVTELTRQLEAPLPSKPSAQKGLVTNENDSQVADSAASSGLSGPTPTTFYQWEQPETTLDGDGLKQLCRQLLTHPDWTMQGPPTIYPVKTQPGDWLAVLPLQSGSLSIRTRQAATLLTIEVSGHFTDGSPLDTIYLDGVLRDYFL